jgi:hypothetical protein
LRIGGTIFFLSPFISRLGYLLKATFLFAFRGGMIFGAFVLIFGSVAGFFSMSIINGDGELAVLIALPAAVVSSVVGLIFGALVGAIIGLVTADHYHVILRKLDDFILSIVIVSTENKITLVWWLSAVLGSFLGLAAANGFNMIERQDSIQAILFAAGGALICSVIAIAVAWKLEQQK